MNPEEWPKVKELYWAALERDPAVRAEFLQQACAGDDGLRAEVESLLAYEAEADTAPPEPAIPERLGPYQIVREIGRGGMAVVYLATRADEQFRKRVAIKVVRQGLGTDEVLRRFRNERQLLASLDHPNIVKLLDGGTTQAGLPYLVTDFVEGLPINEYCDSRRLSITERLQLFRTICGSVHYAHQSLVIHRDLKPSNILVTADGTPKLLDFGIAKLLAPAAAGDDALLVTRTELRVMTPEYASPEQVRGDPITTASDIYSLGVLLYELLTGHRPYRFKRQSLFEIERVICEQEPEKPSTAISRVVENVLPDGTTQTLTPDEVSRTREAGPEKLRSRLHGDLDSIILMALRKEPQRRYASVEQFSEDIRRHLEGLPVIARTGTFVYRSSKFVRRHLAGMVAACVVLLTLIAGIVATSREAALARAEKAKAERRFNDVRQLANSFLFEFHDDIKDLPGSTPARKLVVRKALEYLDSLAHESSGDAALQSELAEAYLRTGDIQGNPKRANLGDVGGALESYRKGEAIAQSVLRNRPKNFPAIRVLARSQQRIGQILAQMGQPQQGADKLRQAISTFEALPSPETQDRLELGACYDSLGDVLGHGSVLNLGSKSGALDAYRKALSISEPISIAEPSNTLAKHDTAVEYAKIGDTLLAGGDTAGALEQERKAVAGFEALAAADPQNAAMRRELSVVYNKLANILWETGGKKEALKIYREGLASALALAAADPRNALLRFDVAVGYRNLAEALLELGQQRAGIENFRRALTVAEEVVAADPANTQRRSELAEGLVTFGGILAKAGRLAEARRYTERGLRIQRALLDRPQVTAAELRQYTLTLLNCQPAELRDAAQAVRFAQRAVEMTDSRDPQNLDALAQAYYAAGENGNALQTEEKALTVLGNPDQAAARGLEKDLQAHLEKFKGHVRPAQHH